MLQRGDPVYIYEVTYRQDSMTDHSIRRIPIVHQEHRTITVTATDRTLLTTLSAQIPGKFDITMARRVKRVG